MQRIVITVDLTENPGAVNGIDDARELLFRISAGFNKGKVSIETADTIGFVRDCGYDHAEYCSDCIFCDKALACKLVEDYSR